MAMTRSAGAPAIGAAAASGRVASGACRAPQRPRVFCRGPDPGRTGEGAQRSTARRSALPTVLPPRARRGGTIAADSLCRASEGKGAPRSSLPRGTCGEDAGGTREERAGPMPRLLHMADVHLGARHHDLGQAAAEQRERQFDAFQRALDLALEERVDVVLVAGDLFDNNQQPRRSVERAAAELGRIAAAGGRVVLIPGTHDVYDHGSLYRVHDLAVLAGAQGGRGRARGAHAGTTGSGLPRSRTWPSMDASSTRSVLPAARSRASARPRTTRATWRVGLVHGSLRIEGKVPDDDVIFSERGDRRLRPRLPRARPLALLPAGPGGGHDLGLRRRAGAGRGRPGRRRPGRAGGPRGGGRRQARPPRGTAHRAHASSCASTSMPPRWPVSPRSRSASGPCRP